MKILDKYYKSLPIDQKNFVDKGYKIFDIENLELLDELTEKFKFFINKNFDINIKNLEHLHEHVTSEDINQIRMGFYNYINDDGLFSENYLKLGYEGIKELAGSELAGNKNVNFSIQLPNDITSTLGIHCDSYSGESDFQINLWVPLTNSFDTNSMFLFDPKFSNEINSSLSDYEEIGIEGLLDTHEGHYDFLNIPYGKGLIFTPTCLHGNVVNKTKSTRISFNSRYKNFFSPYSENKESNKNIGSFYKPISLKAASIVGFRSNIK